MRTGAQWSALGSDYPPKSTCYYWFRKLLDGGTFALLFQELICILDKAGHIDLSETYIDATFVRTKAGSDKIGKTKCGKGRKLMAICDKASRPIALFIASTSKAEIKLLTHTCDMLETKKSLERIIADRAYDSDKHDAELKQQGIDLIEFNRKNRTKNFQDKRLLRRYKRRHKIENFFAHLHNYRSCIIAHDKKADTFLASYLSLQLISYSIKLNVNRKSMLDSF